MPRSRILLVIALLLPSLANAATCARPDRPHFPDPKTAAPDAVEKLDAAMQKYAAATNAYVQCLSKEAHDAEAEGAKTITSYNNDFLPAYNKRAATP